MSKWIFLSKNLEDPYINMFARGCSTEPVDDVDYDSSNDPIILRGILKKKLIKKCLRKDRTFYYMDTGYFGNEISSSNPNGWKYWHRIVKNDLQHGEIIKRPPDRFQQFGKKFLPWKRSGRKILVALPDEKPCKFYDIDRDEWIRKTVDTIKKYTDRPVVIRERSPQRVDRITTNTLQQALNDDVFALVTFNSVAATESVFQGIPAFTLAPANAASPVCLQDLSQIEKPYYADSDKLFEWACHLAYGQFHISELKNGKAKSMLEEWYDD